MTIAALLLLALAQDKVKLELKAAAGEKILHTRRDSNTGKVVVSVAGQKVTQNTLETQTRRHRDEVLEVDGLLPIKVKRTIEEWSETKQTPGAPEPVKTVKALQGRTIVLRRAAGDATVVEGADGLPPAELRKQRLKPEILFGNFPAEPVGVGQEWALGEQALLQDFRETADEDAASFTTASGTGKLEKIEEHKGARCAVVLVSVKAAGNIHGQKDLKASFEVRARAWVDLAKGRLLTLKGEGEGKVAGSIDQEGEKIGIDGGFTLSMEAEQVYE